LLHGYFAKVTFEEPQIFCLQRSKQPIANFQGGIPCDAVRKMKIKGLRFRVSAFAPSVR
jgi:hypothetical protein